MGPKNQLFAYDFRKELRGDEKRLEDYEVFDKDVLAPGDGVVCQVIDGSIDIEPGERDRFVAFGNAIIIDHQNGEWSVLCHFKHNSIKVSVNDMIKQGQIIGQCGNTGNTSGPHIHYHLQDRALAHKATGLPAQFRKILVDGEIKEKFEPVRFQRVSNL